MTNKEAIEILSNRLNTYYCTDEDLQALDLAIKALEEWDRMKLVCANDGIVVYKIEEAHNERTSI